MGLKNVVPTSIAVSSGSGTVNSNGTVDFSGATSISLNGVFTSTYTNYKIIFKTIPASGSPVISFRLRTGGVDSTASAYSNSGYVNTGASSGIINNVNLTNLNMIIGYATVPSILNMEIGNPATTSQKSFLSHSNGSNGTSIISIHSAGYIGLNSAHDGITFTSSVANALIGTVQVFGYTN